MGHLTAVPREEGSSESVARCTHIVESHSHAVANSYSHAVVLLVMHLYPPAWYSSAGGRGGKSRKGREEEEGGEEEEAEDAAARRKGGRADKAKKGGKDRGGPRGHTSSDSGGASAESPVLGAEEVLSAMREGVQGAREALRRELGKLRTGRAQAGKSKSKSHAFTLKHPSTLFQEE